MKAGRLPKISPLSGQPAETPRKYRFRTAPQWVWALIAAGILVGVGWIPGVIVMLAVSKSESGPLYLTFSEKRSILVKHIVTWSFLTLALIGFALAFTVDVNYKGIAVVAAFVGTIGWFICALGVLPKIRPRATVRVLPSGAKTVELKQVHPIFAQAVAGMYQAAPVVAPGVGL